MKYDENKIKKLSTLKSKKQNKTKKEKNLQHADKGIRDGIP